ncbi:MAG: OmpA family protein [Pseudomonadota bacterium]
MAVAYSSRRTRGRRPNASARKMGTWKLAYADFLTALCAFFLIMWIIHGISAGERENLAQQFGSEKTAETAITTADDAVSLGLADDLRNNPALASFGASVRITEEPNFVRIDLSDMAERPLFETGDGRLNSTGERLVRLAGSAISLIDLPILIEGHTDAHPSLTDGYSNWELSADRANSARRLLMEAGVNEARITGVAGLAHTQPLLQNAPEDAANRRISIVLVIRDETA